MAKVKLTQEQRVNKAEELNNSRLLKVWRVSKYPEVKNVANQLFTEMKTQGLVSKRYAEDLHDHVSKIVLDLYTAYRSDPKLYLSYSRNRNDYYGKVSKYKNLGYNHTIKTIEFLKGIQTIPANPDNPE